MGLPIDAGSEYLHDMTRFQELLRTDFEGRPTEDIDDVVLDAFDDPRYRERVPGIIELMNDPAAPESERFLACFALTTWAEPQGYEAVLRAAADPKNAPWYDVLIDRKFSVDSTFAQLATAAAERDMVAEKGTAEQRVEVLRALTRLADREYFEDKLGEIVDDDTLRLLLDDVRSVVERGVRLIADGGKQSFDLTTQLVDLAAGAARVDVPLAVDLALRVLSVSSSPRALRHAVTLIHRAPGPEGQRFAAYVTSIGDEEVRGLVREALARTARAQA